MRQAIAILLLLLSSVLTCNAAQPTSESIDTLLTLTRTDAFIESPRRELSKYLENVLTRGRL